MARQRRGWYRAGALSSCPSGGRARDRGEPESKPLTRVCCPNNGYSNYSSGSFKANSIRFLVDDFPTDSSRETARLGERIRIYEQLQELNRVTQAASVVHGRCCRYHVLDASDLRNSRSLLPKAGPTNRKQTACDLGTLAMIGICSIGHDLLALQLLSEGMGCAEFLQYKQLLRSGPGTPGDHPTINSAHRKHRPKSRDMSRAWQPAEIRSLQQSSISSICAPPR